MPTIALDSGQWFDVADATKWAATDGSCLYLIGDKWALHDTLAALMAPTPAKLIDAQAALQWFTCHGGDIPAELRPLAEQTRLRSVPVSAALEVSS